MSENTPAAPAANDTFANIAARGLDLHRTELAPQLPPPLPERLLVLTEATDPALPPPSEARFAEPDFASAIAQQREKYAPFLESHAPPFSAARIVTPLTQAEWRMDGETAWTPVRIPHYGGPQGRARSWYRFSFAVTQAMLSGGCILACFRAVDYQAAVFCNGHLVGQHEGFFAPFTCDLTTAVHEGDNELLVRVDNDAICMGNGSWGKREWQGDKIYAATGLGWDEPGLGWHHCPAGMGIPQGVTIEARPLLHVHDLWVRVLDLQGNVEIHAEVWNAGRENLPLQLSFRVDGENFLENAVAEGAFGELQEAGPGVNFYRTTVQLPSPRIWDVETPWLYRLTVTCGDDASATRFGVRLFAYLRRNQFCEAVRQSAEMERLLRAHASAVLVSFINEPFPQSWGDKTHRHLNRAQLEAFFRAATEAVHLENPDRMIKPIDGDYDPPGPGLPDNHAYPAWYNGHALELGKLHKGHWVPIKPEWLCACGEFGSEGLETADFMRRHYPASWLPQSPEEERDWTPTRIAQCQTGNMYGLFMDRQHSLEDWVQHSQAHQAWSTALMTRALRRNPKLISFAIHLLIDAFPAGWLKCLVDCERRPKEAWFAYRSALAPLLADIRLDRTAWFGGDTLTGELWVCHDTHEVFLDAKIRCTLTVEGSTQRLVHESPARLEADEPVCQGTFQALLPEVRQRTKATVSLAILSGSGEVLNQHQVTLDLFPRTPAEVRQPTVTVYGEPGSDAHRFAEEAALAAGDDLHVVSDFEAFAQHREAILSAVSAGKTALLLNLPPGQLDLPEGDRVVLAEAGMDARIFVSRATGHPAVAEFEVNDFRFWYDEAEDRPAPVLKTLFQVGGEKSPWQPILLTCQGGWGAKWEPALACAERSYGQGKLIICQLLLRGRWQTNPVAQRLMSNLLQPPQKS